MSSIGCTNAVQKQYCLEELMISDYLDCVYEMTYQSLENGMLSDKECKSVIRRLDAVSKILDQAEYRRANPETV